MYYECECNDKGCHAHEGVPACQNKGTVILYRVDMHDLSGTLFCEDCASDAMDSGLFSTESVLDIENQ